MISGFIFPSPGLPLVSFVWMRRRCFYYNEAALAGKTRVHFRTASPEKHSTPLPFWKAFAS